VLLKKGDVAVAVAAVAPAFWVNLDKGDNAPSLLLGAVNEYDAFATVDTVDDNG
jgi:hypothetical protein